MSALPAHHNFVNHLPVVAMNGMNYVLVPQPPVYMDPLLGQPMMLAPSYPPFANFAAPQPMAPMLFKPDEALAPTLFSGDDLLAELESHASTPEVPSSPGSVSSPVLCSTDLPSVNSASVHTTSRSRPSPSTPAAAQTPALDSAPVQNEFTSPVNGQNIKLFLKSAKSKSESFVSEFPSSLLCQPYKYDIKVVGPTELMQHKINMYLVYADTLAKPYTVKPSLIVMKEDAQDNERTIRFQMTLCSFHFGKRKFRLAIEFSEGEGDDAKPVSLFFSAPFNTFARKKVGDCMSLSPRGVTGKRWLARDEDMPAPKRMRFDAEIPPSSHQAAMQHAVNPREMAQPLRVDGRASAAIALLDSLTPDERQAVSMYLELTGAQQTM